MAYADGEAGGKQYQPHASIRGHLAPEDEHAGGEARLELDEEDEEDEDEQDA